MCPASAKQSDRDHFFILKLYGPWRGFQDIDYLFRRYMCLGMYCLLASLLLASIMLSSFFACLLPAAVDGPNPAPLFVPSCFPHPCNFNNIVTI